MKSIKNKQKNKTKKRQKVKTKCENKKHIGGAASSNNTIAQTNDRIAQTNDRGNPIVTGRPGIIGNGRAIPYNERRQSEQAAEEARLNLLRSQAELQAAQARLNLLRAQAELRAAQDRLDSALWARGIRDAGGYQAIG